MSHDHDCARCLLRAVRDALTKACEATGWVWFVYWDVELRRHHIWIGPPNDPKPLVG